MKQELPKIKAEQPNITHKAAFKEAAQRVSIKNNIKLFFKLVIENYLIKYFFLCIYIFFLINLNNSGRYLQITQRTKFKLYALHL